MKTNVAQTSIDCFYGAVQTKKQRQYDLILSAMELGKDYSFSELFELTGILPSTLSARINEMRDKLGLVERAPRRNCAKTGVRVIPHRLKIFAGEWGKTSPTNNDSADVLQVQFDFSQKEAA